MEAILLWVFLMLTFISVFIQRAGGNCMACMQNLSVNSDLY